MKQIKETSELKVGMIILTGSAYYKVEGWTHITFSGPRWNEEKKDWDGWATIPLPSRCHPAHEIPESYFRV